MKKWIVGTFVILLLFAGVYYFVPETALPANKTITKLVVHKSERTMEVYSGDILLKTYRISLGGNPIGDKEFEGDRKTPEGQYTINGKNPNSSYHKNLAISYPNADDILDAKRRNVSPGGEIKIHGIRNGLTFIGKFHRTWDWTAGCIAVTDEEIDELYNAVAIGTPVIIMP